MPRTIYVMTQIDRFKLAMLRFRKSMRAAAASFEEFSKIPKDHNLIEQEVDPFPVERM